MNARTNHLTAPDPDTNMAAVTESIPPGWKLVPVEPTTEMWKAGLAFMYRDVESVWSAMLQAAPSASIRSK